MKQNIVALENRKSIIKSGTGITRGPSLANRTSTFGARTRGAASTPLGPTTDPRRRSNPAGEPIPPAPSTYFAVDNDGTSYFAEGYYDSE